MASSMSVYCEILARGLDEERKRNQKKMKTLLDCGADQDEAYRIVYHPRMTPEQFKKLQDSYRMIFWKD
jgi:hypothetical protein